MATERTLILGRRDFLVAAGILATAPLLGGAATPASAQAIGDASGASTGAIGRQKLGSLEVSSIGLGVQNMSRTYQTTIPSRTGRAAPSTPPPRRRCGSSPRGYGRRSSRTTSAPRSSPPA